MQEVVPSCSSIKNNKSHFSCKDISAVSREDLCYYRIHNRGMVILLFFFMPLWAPGIFSNVVLQELSAPIGGSVLFQVKLSTETYLNSIFWASIRKGKKQMLAIAKPDSFRVIDSTFKKRLKCQESGQTLNLSDLREEDSGIYEAEIYGSGNTTHLWFHLQVNSKSKDKASSDLSNVVLQELSATQGGSILFHVNLSSDTDLNIIFWLSTREGIKQMLAVSKIDSFKVIDSTFNNRVRCQEPGLSLNLSDLREEDSGIYQAEIFSSRSAVHLLFHLQVTGKRQNKAGSYSGGAPGTWNNICLTIFGILISYIIGKT
ncbi:uncharacterized protein [Aquarana catesbeiana]|uniref:uncharacterized protein n=1 Tax=Aquarana catesbeiana TaxID=8400 RepID=UPI003CC96346